MREGQAQLPIPVVRRLEAVPERTLYVARPGLLALPTGTFTFLAFISPQIVSSFVLLWAIWWPAPTTTGMLVFALSGTAVMIALVAGILTVVIRRNPGFALGLVRAPFIRLTVTDRRVIWSLPWMDQPLMEIDRRRVLGGELGMVNARGRGHAMMILVPNDPAADIDGNIHFDRLPDAASFVAALRRA
ncbi:hypothetical protein [Flavisphingomonas formosensis]|uniref:hypothetical protein n=1 Tax=Flavisphingomonas formosensis TaxID=861534 RepID=UPI0012F8EA4B|nr:hypothetical protein [Sphingomonas formosensis]